MTLLTRRALLLGSAAVLGATKLPPVLALAASEPLLAPTAPIPRVYGTLRRAVEVITNIEYAEFESRQSMIIRTEETHLEPGTRIAIDSKTGFARQAGPYEEDCGVAGVFIRVHDSGEDEELFG